MNRCINHIFDYCSNKPRIITKKVETTIFDLGNRQHIQTATVTLCRRNHLHCLHRRTQSNLVALTKK